MKKKISIIALCVAVAGVIAYFPIKTALGGNDVMSQWGKILSDDSKNETSGSKGKFRIATDGPAAQTYSASDEIFECGKDILITKREIEVSKAFYMLKGESEKTAEKEAVKYMEEFNAMYVKAIKAGFDVTDEEVDNYIADLKKMSDEAENADDVKKVIAQFDSEDEYWAYEKEVYQKQFPIQKYFESLESDYVKKPGTDVNNESGTKAWNKELDKIKEKAAKEQKYKKVKSVKDIDNKFVK